MQSSPPKRPQFAFIDGLRALCALYIVIHHTLPAVGWQSVWTFPFQFGLEIVVIFITISGFCLALPLASSGKWQLDAPRFYWKRARRILPPYYAAVAIGILIIVVSTLRGHAEDYREAPVSAAMIWSHLALVQNWMPNQFSTLDGPLWSIAVECQIYLLFPVLVVLRRRSGRWPANLIWIVAASLLMKLTHSTGVDFLLLIFGLGVLGADLAYLPATRRWLVPAALISFAAMALLHARHAVLADDLLGLAVAFLMAYWVQSPASAGHRILGWKPLAWIGTFSYSIYLIHSYFQVLAARWFAAQPERWHGHTQQEVGIALLSLIPLILLTSYGFHIAFERPFMGKARQTQETILAPAALT